MFSFKAFFGCLLVLVASASVPNTNDRPIIGILSEELTAKMTTNYGEHKGYIASSYVQFVHGAGARAVPILIGENEGYYKSVLQNLNGVLLPGGSVWFDNKTEGYVQAGRWILEEANRLNDDGQFFPIWGTCLGFELMTYIENEENDIRSNCSAYNVASPMNFTAEAKSSRLFSMAPANIFDIASNRNSTTNFHRFCITFQDLKKSELKDKWRVLTTSVDDSGLEYISTAEHTTYPYYGTQWHAEKPLYEWGHHNTPHDQYAALLSQYMANFFVNEARKSNHSFPSEEVEREYLIYKYPATFGNPTSTYTQLYFFD